MHLAPTEEQARAEVAYGLSDWVVYFQRVAALPIAPDTAPGQDLVDALNQTGLAVIGTPDMAVAQIQRLIDQSGGFGTYLFMAHEWADRQATLRSYELFAQEVMPLFQDASRTLVRSRDWAAANRETFIGSAVQAVMQSVQEHYAEKDARQTTD
jgi:limonene 1,2-monooxygenase